jgi:uncharacterized membrane protein
MWTNRHRWIVAGASSVGAGISGYLAYTKVSGSSLLCVGRGCEIVNSSPFAVVMGVPVAFLGLGMYLALLCLVTWETLLSHRRPVGSSPHLALHPFLLQAAIFAIALAGTIYSAYLTAIELFWLRAICSWCVASAILVTAIAATSAHGVLLRASP